MASAARNERTINPDTGKPEDQFRELVRDALGLTWEVRDVAIFAELKRLKALEGLKPSQALERAIAQSEIDRIRHINYLADENKSLREIAEYQRGGHGW